MRVSSRLLVLPVLVLASVVHLTNSGIIDFASTFDGWVFLYGGQQVLNGQIPYLDFWDNKPLLIYFLNAMGLFVGGGSRIGVVILENALFMGAAWLGFFNIQRVYGSWPAFVGSCAWLLSAFLLLTGCNGVLSYALILQFLCWHCFIQIIGGVREKLNVILLGVITGLLLSLKPTLIISGAVMMAFVVAQKLQRGERFLTVKTMGLYFSGAILPILPLGLYTWSHGITALMIDNVFLFPSRFLVCREWGDQVRSLSGNARILLMNGMLPYAAIGGILFAWKVKKKALNGLQFLLPCCAMVLFLMEAWVGCLSGRPWRHYALPWLPSLSVVAAVGTYCLASIGTNCQVRCYVAQEK